MSPPPYYICEVKNIKILAIDQSTKITGYSIWEDKKLINYGIIEVDQNEKNPIERMCQMYFLIKNLIDEIEPEFVTIEGIQFQRNYSTYSLLSQLQGLIFSILFERDMAFLLVEPTKWKSFCKIKGRKRIEQKANTIQMVKDKFNIEVSEDIADAIGIGLYTVNKILK